MLFANNLRAYAQSKACKLLERIVSAYMRDHDVNCCLYTLYDYGAALSKDKLENIGIQFCRVHSLSFQS
jgi:hypothetical protein